MHGNCELCKSSKPIMRSHAIPDSIFKRIFRENNGKGILLTLDDAEIDYSSDSWWEHQLCTDCESLLNDNYEKYALQVLRGTKGNFSKQDEGLSFKEINLHKLTIFFISILWRTSVSNHQAYSSIRLGDYINEYLRSSILHDKKLISANITVKISR